MLAREPGRSHQTNNNKNEDGGRAQATPEHLRDDRIQTIPSTEMMGDFKTAGRMRKDTSELQKQGMTASSDSRPRHGEGKWSLREHSPVSTEALCGERKAEESTSPPVKLGGGQGLLPRRPSTPPLGREGGTPQGWRSGLRGQHWMRHAVLESAAYAQA